MHCLSRYPNKEHVENEYTNDKGLARVRPCMPYKVTNGHNEQYTKVCKSVQTFSIL